MFLLLYSALQLLSQSLGSNFFSFSGHLVRLLLLLQCCSAGLPPSIKRVPKRTQEEEEKVKDGGKRKKMFQIFIAAWRLMCVYDPSQCWAHSPGGKLYTYKAQTIALFSASIGGGGPGQDGSGMLPMFLRLAGASFPSSSSSFWCDTVV